MHGKNCGMNWQKITTELLAAFGTKAKLAKLAICSEAHITAILAGKTEPSYSVGDRLIRMHDQMREMRVK